MIRRESADLTDIFFGGLVNYYNFFLLPRNIRQCFSMQFSVMTVLLLLFTLWLYFISYKYRYLTTAKLNWRCWKHIYDKWYIFKYINYFHRFMIQVYCNLIINILFCLEKTSLLKSYFDCNIVAFWYFWSLTGALLSCILFFLK